MGPKPKSQYFTDSIMGQHLALSVAAHLARTQLVSDPLAFSDAQHLSDMLDLVGWPGDGILWIPGGASA